MHEVCSNNKGWTCGWKVCTALIFQILPFFGFVSATLHVHQLLIFTSFWLRAISVAIYTQPYNIDVSQQRFLCIKTAKDLPSESVTEHENSGSRNRLIQRSVMKNTKRSKWEHEEKGNTTFFCRYLLNKRTAQMYLSKLFSDVTS